MKLPWIIAGVAIGAAAYIIANQPGPEYATGSDSLEDAARRSSAWGSGKRITGTGQGLVGKAKQAVGNFTGSDDLQAEGAGDRITGGLKDAAGSVAQAAGNAIHEINK